MPDTTEALTGDSASRASQLGINEYALAALEYQARRLYGRWRLQQAEAIAQRVVRFEVGRAGAWFVLGDIEMRRANFERAFGHFQQAVDCNRGDAMAWCRGAEALLRVGDHQRAQRWLEEAVRLGSPDGHPGADRALSILERFSDVFEQRQRRTEPAPTQEVTRRVRALRTPGNTAAGGAKTGGVRSDEGGRH